MVGHCLFHQAAIDAVSMFCYHGEVPSSFVMSGGIEDTGVLGDLCERCAS